MIAIGMIMRAMGMVLIALFWYHMPLTWSMVVSAAIVNSFAALTMGWLVLCVNTSTLNKALYRAVLANTTFLLELKDVLVFAAQRKPLTSEQLLDEDLQRLGPDDSDDDSSDGASDETPALVGAAGAVAAAPEPLEQGAGEAGVVLGGGDGVEEAP